MSRKKGLLIVLSGPSGTGKGTVLKELAKVNENIKVSISATTRSPREGEIDGREYFFMSKEKFLSVAANGGMLEFAEYCGNFYGTPKQAVDTWLEQGFDVVLEIEVQGGRQVKKLCKDAIGIFIVPPSIEELKERLVNRKTNTHDDIKNRLNVAADELECACDYDYTVTNDTVENCVNRIYDIIKFEKKQTTEIY